MHRPRHQPRTGATPHHRRPRPSSAPGQQEVRRPPPQRRLRPPQRRPRRTVQARQALASPRHHRHHQRHRQRRMPLHPLDGPLEAEIVFTVRKPASAPKRRRTWPTTRDSGDIDKLLRSTFDGIADGNGVVDDSRIIRVAAIKTFPGEHPEALPEPGAIIRLYTLPGDPR
ncbi:RusA family crossover junction endodeoxyribonuclease [Streptomyces sp. SHP22-7]|nr:RusA family crossover junction endodeoxyribonuclease [Streptomyces sp. SHP22-7]